MGIQPIVKGKMMPEGTQRGEWQTSEQRENLPTDPHSGWAKLLYHPSYRCFSYVPLMRSETKEKKFNKYIRTTSTGILTTEH